MDFPGKLYFFFVFVLKTKLSEDIRWKSKIVIKHVFSYNAHGAMAIPQFVFWY